jgi:hypothetical protein
MNPSERAGSSQSRPQEQQLLLDIKERLPELEKLLHEVESHWGMEDTFYRFYHQSFKVFEKAQSLTEKIVTALKQLLPERELNKWFTDIVAEGTGRQFKLEDNEHWSESIRPMLEALFHAQFFLKMVCKYGKELEEAPQMMPSGWAAVLYLYGLR